MGMGKNRIRIPRQILSVMLVVAAVLLGGWLSACGVSGEPAWIGSAAPYGTEESNAVETTLSLQELEEQTRESMLSEKVYCYAYSGLSAAEQIWYRDIAETLGIMASEAKLSEEGFDQGLDETVVDKIFQAVLVDHPELFYVEGYSYTKYTVADKLVSIDFTGTYSMTWEEAQERAQEITQKAEEILQAVPDSDEDYERIKFVYDTLILNTDYDRNAMDNQNIYSVFVGKASVCQGYAKAFQYLLNRMEIDCTLVQGTVTESGEGHAWNLVNADGNFYYMDVTWGDISFRSAEEDSEEEQNLEQQMHEWIGYDYFCITTDQLLRTHLPSDLIELPECSAVADNYYVREGAFFTEYDKEQLQGLILKKIQTARQSGEGEAVISLCCADEACYDEFCTRLLDTQELFRYLEGTGIKSFIYSIDDKQYTLTFFMVTTTG